MEALYKYIPHVCLLWKNLVFANNLEVIEEFKKQMPSKISYAKDQSEVWDRVRV